MHDPLEKQRRKLARQEEKHLKRAPVGGRLAAAVKVPDGVRNTLAAAFAKSFGLVFRQGAGLIEKTYDRALLEAEFTVRDRQAGGAPHAKQLRALDSRAKKVRRAGSGAALAEGLGLGVLGIGLPDLPLFLAALLRGVYQIALSYGFAYDTPAERAYILRLLACAAAPSPAGQEAVDAMADALARGAVPPPDLEAEIRTAADCMADAMLTAKFIQGLPLIGAAGGALNLPIYRRVTAYAALQYRKRYLARKQSP